MGEIALFNLAIFLLGAFVAAFVTGLTGFAFAMVAAAIWLHALTPIQATAMIVAYALLVQGYAVWKLRQALNLRRLAPFVAGSAVGIPAGIAVLQWAPASDLRIGVGVLLILFSLNNLMRPKLPEVKESGTALDTTVGVFNGVLGGSTGLAGIILVIWCGMRGWTRDEQRAIFQPAAVATFLMTLAWLGGAGFLTADVGRYFVFGLPALIAGTWLGWKAYGRLEEASFRKAVLYLLLISGVALVAAWR